MHIDYEQVLGVAAGVGLAAACGFRVFVPLLIAAIAVRAGAIDVAAGFEWLGATPVLVALGLATLLEIGAYFIPGVDHALDTVATPAAVVAGTLVCASFVVDAEPWVRWMLAAIAGGGAAAAVQGATVAVRGASGVTTLGLANPAVAGAELVGASLASTLAVLVPLVSILVLVLLVACFVRARRRDAARAALA